MFLPVIIQVDRNGNPLPRAARLALRREDRRGRFEAILIVMTWMVILCSFVVLVGAAVALTGLS